MDISSTLILPTDPSSSHISHSMGYDPSNNIWSRWTTTPNPFFNIIANNNIINTINNVPDISTESIIYHSHDISNGRPPHLYIGGSRLHSTRRPLPLTPSGRFGDRLSYAFRRDPVEESFNDENKYKHIIADKEANNLKTLPYHAKDYADREICPITREKFEEGEEVILLPCSHLFNKDGILHWLKKFDATCPVCRHTFTSKEVKKDIPALRSQTRDISFRNLLLNLVDDQLRREDDALLQQALLASLRDTT